ncbi:MAG: NAD(P)H:quinone oxidoreductase [Actinomycetes bacterium]
MSASIAVIYYSATGNVHQLAEAVAEGAQGVGAEVRLRRVPELSTAEAIAANPAWQAHSDATSEHVEVATLADLEWANGYAFGTPTRYGNMAAPLKQFIDSTGQLWASGKLANKVATSFVSTQNQHGGAESTALALNNTFYHWGAIIVPPGYTDERVFGAGGNPYATSYPSGGGGGPIGDFHLDAARHQGARLAEYAQRLG